MKKGLWILSLIGALSLGVIVTQWWYRPTSIQTSVETHSLLQQVKKVFKMVTVEGSFLEIYDYEDFYYYDWSPFRKKALVKVKAKVSLGYDLEGLEIEAHEPSRTLRISNMPQVSIIAMDIQPSYYDLQEGVFNSFSPKDHNKLMQDVRAMVESDVWSSDLPQQADRQRDEMLSLLGDVLKAQAWTLEYNHMQQKPRYLDQWVHFPKLKN